MHGYNVRKFLWGKIMLDLSELRSGKYNAGDMEKATVRVTFQ